MRDFIIQIPKLIDTQKTFHQQLQIEAHSLGHCFLHDMVSKLETPGLSSLLGTSRGNAIYNLRHPWLRFLYAQLEQEAFTESWTMIDCQCYIVVSHLDGSKVTIGQKPFADVPLPTLNMDETSNCVAK